MWSSRLGLGGNTLARGRAGRVVAGWHAALAPLALLACGDREASEPTLDGGSVADAEPDGGLPADAAVDSGGGDRYEALAVVVERERRALGVPGVAVAVVEDGEVRFAAGFGLRDPRRDEAVTPRTIFPIGSTTKPLTALALLRLVDEGAVDLDAPVVDYVPELAVRSGAEHLPAVVVRHLLTQSSGLPDQPVVWSWPDTSDTVLDDYLAGPSFSERYGLMFPPGRMYYYSNLGFDLAGLIVERVGGRFYADYMQSEVLDLLGMSRATFRVARAEADGDFAVGTMDGRVVDSLASTPPWQRPSGLAFASVLDLAELARFVMDGDPAVLSPALHDAMTTPQIDTAVHLDRIQQGLGLMIFRGLPSQAGLLDLDVTTVTHGGMVLGHTAHVLVIPEHRFAFVFAANAHDAWFDRSVVTAVTATLALPEPPLARAPEDPAALSDYAGVYVADPGTPGGPGDIAVRLEEGALHMTSADGSLDCVMTPLTTANFHCPNGYPFPVSTLTFLRDGRGDVEYLRAMGLGFTARSRADP